MDNKAIAVYVLTTLKINSKGDVSSKNVGVTCSILEADEHKALAFENDFETLPMTPKWQEDAEITNLIGAIRGFRDMVEDMQVEALR